MLDNTKERDIDQVVSRWCQTVKSEPRHNILMVDQLWLWSTCQRPSTPGVADHKFTSRPKGEQSYVNGREDPTAANQD
jgi:hypothetical protein